jgi:hypothetical protein
MRHPTFANEIPGKQDEGAVEFLIQCQTRQDILVRVEMSGALVRWPIGLMEGLAKPRIFVVSFSLSDPSLLKSA